MHGPLPSVSEINRYADEHASLLQTISNYDSAPSALKDTARLIATIKEELAVRERRLVQLAKKRKVEHKDYDSLQRSHIKRFFVRISHGGKEGLSQKLEKEEQEYITALQAEHNETQTIAELKVAVRAAEEKRSELEAQTAERTRLLHRVDELYKSVFSGPTPDFPEEDAAEDALADAERHYDEMQSAVNHELQVRSLLERATSSASLGMQALQSASRAATFDTFGVGGIWNELAERDDLMRAQSSASQAYTYLQQARALHPLVHDVSRAEVVEPEWLNVVFDNIYTDYMFQQKIKNSIVSMSAFHRALLYQQEQSAARARALEAPVEDAVEHMRGCRRELTAVRREILTRAAEDSRDAPPGYGTTPQPGAFAPPPAPPPDALRAPSYETSVRSAQLPSAASSYAPPPVPPPGAPSIPSYDTAVRSGPTPGSTPTYAPPPGPPPPGTPRTPSYETSVRSAPEPAPAPAAPQQSPPDYVPTFGSNNPYRSTS